MNRRQFGSKRVVGCECTFAYTCRACLNAATVGLNAPQGVIRIQDIVEVEFQ